MSRKYKSILNFFKGTVQHEVLHVLGFGHEHQRPDRDEYLNVYSNRSLNPAEFEKMTDWFQMEKYPFEAESVLMYCSQCSSIDGSPILTSKNGKLLDNPIRPEIQ